MVFFNKNQLQRVILHLFLGVILIIELKSQKFIKLLNISSQNKKYFIKNYVILRKKLFYLNINIQIIFFKKNIKKQI